MLRSDFVKKELSKLTQVEFTPEEAVILCCFHDDHNPSLRVALTKKVRKSSSGVKTIYPGNFYCFSCGAGGSWNKLAGKLGLIPLNEKTEEEADNTSSNPFAELSRDLEALAPTTTEYIKPITDGPWEGSWRGLSGSFLRSVGAESSWDEEYGEYRILLPISDAFGKQVGHVRARGENSNIPNNKKYLNSKGFNGRAYWYGLNFEEKPQALVIVEGPYDMLRFRSLGIPAIANLGVQMRADSNQDQAVSEEKIMQILAKGCTKIVLALDADRAGRDAVPGMTASFVKWGLQVYDLNMSRYLKNPEDKMDPGNCPQEVIQDLTDFLKGLR